MTDDEKDKYLLLFQKYRKGSCTHEERRIVEKAYLDINQVNPLPSNKELIADLIDLQERHHSIIQPNTRKIKLIRQIAAVAAFVCLLIGGMIYLHKQYAQEEIRESIQLAKEILPGKNRAVLIVDGLERISLSEDHDGLVSTDGRLMYADGTSIETNKQVQHITLQTPNAGQFEATLPDGTKVWLNASSSISYPSKFATHKREVTISGEVYLQVAKNPLKPFVIHTSKQKIEVLGTSFNVKAYASESMHITTLVEGSLRVSGLREQGTEIIKPGEQSLLSEDVGIKVQKVDVDAIVSWKDGVYVIQDLPLEDFGEQLSRWYDIDVDMGVYKNKRLSAMIPRDVPLASVLQAITLNTQIKFKVKGRRISTIE